MNENDILDIRQKADIVDIISEYIPLTQKGKNYFAVCPFHDDHNPSLVVSKEKQIFNCFTCHTGGNVFTFIMKYENVSFPEAVKTVASKVGINVNIHETSSANKYKKEYEIMNLSNKFFTNVLNTAQGMEAKKYLLNRGISDEIIKDFRIGLAGTEKDSLYKFLSSHQFETNAIEELGLINKNGIEIFDTFNNRIMIPIADTNGQIVGYTGRIFHNEDLAKYVNTKETKIFSKGNILFNFHNAKKYIRDIGNVILVEGNMDAIKMAASGFPNVIALMGTALTKNQIDTIKKLRCSVILMLDNDNAGLQATIKNGELLKNAGVDVSVIRLDGHKDPDEFINAEGIDSFKEVLSHPKKYVDFKLDILKEKYDLTSSDGLIKYIKEVLNSLSGEDELAQKILLSRIAKENNFDEGLILNELKLNAQTKEKKNTEIQVINSSKSSTIEKIERKILYFMLNDVKYMKVFTEEIGYFNNKVLRELMNEIKFIYHNNKNTPLADFITYFTSMPQYCEYVLLSINENENIELSYESYEEVLSYYKKIKINEEIKELKEKIKYETNDNKKIKLIEKLTKLKKGCVDNDRN
jgi:DNA primase